ncbi:hypothetical protein [Methylobacterium sp. C25]|uniref:hypothetical protein n=1 Tax=Methylobacterium sp. C25 TaxID=2721622 RepID=UPI001F24F627|nr:hypothetical protein [Methylobacterium sp. C25]
MPPDALPDTMPSPETGLVLTRGFRRFMVAYKDETLLAALPGYYPDGRGEGVHFRNDMSVVETALRILKERSTAYQRRRQSAGFGRS